LSLKDKCIVQAKQKKEETGIDIEVGNLKAVYSNVSKRVQPDGINPIGSIVNFGFTGKAISGELATSEESLEVKWVDREKVLETIGKDFMRDRVKSMLDTDERITYGVFTREPYILHDIQHI